MSSLRRFKQKLSAVSRMWEEEDYDAALAEVESLLKVWPGNANLHILWASLVQLQENPKHELDDAKQALQQAVELDKGSPAAAIELGHFLDNVEDNPRAAAKAYSEGVSGARHLLVDGLIGQAKAYRQLGKRDEFFRCLREVIQLTQSEPGSRRTKARGAVAQSIVSTLAEQLCALEPNGPYAEQIQDLLSEPVKDNAV